MVVAVVVVVVCRVTFVVVGGGIVVVVVLLAAGSASPSFRGLCYRWNVLSLEHGSSVVDSGSQNESVSIKRVKPRRN